jgi:hypothetical protein
MDLAKALMGMARIGKTTFGQVIESGNSSTRYGLNWIREGLATSWLKYPSDKAAKKESSVRLHFQRA